MGGKIQHCPISSKFDMWVDNDVSNWFPHHNLPTYEMSLKSDNVEFVWWPFWKWRPVENFQCRESIRDIIIYPHIKFWWYRTMLNFTTHILRKISTGCHFQNGHHNPAQIQHCSISTSGIDSRHRKISTGLHFQNGHHNTAKIQHCSISHNLTQAIKWVKDPGNTFKSQVGERTSRCEFYRIIK
jgi:hypothetical protein